MDEKNKVQAKERLNVLERDLVNIIGCLETLENSLYFSSERKDKDMTKPCAMCVEAISIMVNNCADQISDITDIIDKIGIVA